MLVTPNNVWKFSKVNYGSESQNFKNYGRRRRRRSYDKKNKNFEENFRYLSHSNFLFLKWKSIFCDFFLRKLWTFLQWLSLVVFLLSIFRFWNRFSIYQLHINFALFIFNVFHGNLSNLNLDKIWKINFRNLGDNFFPLLTLSYQLEVNQFTINFVLFLFVFISNN